MIRISPERKLGPLRSTLHGLNRGPVDRNWYFDLRPWFKHWEVPHVRTHDAIYNAYDTVDLHYLFPNPKADPSDPANYRFDLTDDLLSAIRDTGAAIYFRLGETIEHQPRKMWNRPERWEPEVLAQVCVNIVRHYNHGWAKGFHWGIEYWEFWNEPNGPKNWTGTPEEFFVRYRAVAKAIRAWDASLKVGLAGFGSGFLLRDGEPSVWAEGVSDCARDGVPVDFLSWHIYLKHWKEAEVQSGRIREFLDQHGMQGVESHLGEWGARFHMNVEARAVSIFSARDMRRYDVLRKLAERQRGAEGAALVFGTLAALQDAPVDLSQYYCGDTYSLFGLFDAFGVLGRRGMAFEAFCSLLKLEEGSERVAVECLDEDVIATAVLEPSGHLHVGIASLGEGKSLPIALPTVGQGWQPCRMRLLDDEHPMQEVPLQINEEGQLEVPLIGPSVVMVEYALVEVGRSEPRAAVNAVALSGEPA